MQRLSLILSVVFLSCLSITGRLSATDAKEYFYRGVDWQDKGEYDKAIADMTEVIRRNPQAAQAYDCRADLHDRKHEPDKAAADYAQAMRLRRNGRYR